MSLILRRRDSVSLSPTCPVRFDVGTVPRRDLSKQHAFHRRNGRREHQVLDNGVSPLWQHKAADSPYSTRTCVFYSVSVRVRPLNERENDEKFAWNSDGTTIWPEGRSNTRFTVDRVFGPASTTSEIYEADIRSLIEKVVLGINATFFAYGQTSSGKTYTIQGTDAADGVIKLAVHDIFDLIRSNDAREFLCRASYIEVRLLL